MDSEEENWLKLHRKIIENVFLMSDNMAYFVFMRLLPLTGRVKGQYFGSTRELAKQFNIKSHNTLYSILKRLEKEQIIKLENKHHKTVITICNWSKYQPPRQTPKRTTDKQPTNNRQTTDKHFTPVTKTAEENRREKNIHSDYNLLEPAITEFINMRKLIKRPLLDGGVKRLVSKLNTMYPEDYEKQQSCLLQSVDHGWIGIFELKGKALTARKGTDGWL